MHPDEPAVNNWRATDSDFFTEGEGGAGLAIARLGRVPSWPGTGHEAAKGRHQPANRAFCSLSIVWRSDLRKPDLQGNLTLTRGVRPSYMEGAVPLVKQENIRHNI